MGVDAYIQNDPLEVYLNMTVHAIPCSGRSIYILISYKYKSTIVTYTRCH